MEPVIYKYRSLASLEFFLDILVYQRLFAARYDMLNDPMEGAFTYSDDPKLKAFVKRLSDEKEALNVCSLSETPTNTLLWAYYGDSHAGAAVGVQTPAEGGSIVRVAPVKYTTSLKFKPFVGSLPDEEAIGVLSKKLTPWKHEREVRIFSKTPHVPVKVVEVVLGYKVPERRVELLTKLVKAIDPDICVKKIEQGELDSQLALHRPVAARKRR